jgi:hypothetical protein
VHSREFPYRVSVDAYRSLLEWIDRYCEVDAIIGVPISTNFMVSTGIGNLLAPSDESYFSVRTRIRFN